MINKVRLSDQTAEDQANTIAGRIMRDFDNKHPEVFKDMPIKEDGVAANAVGAGGISADSPGPIQGTTPFLFGKKSKKDNPFAALRTRPLRRKLSNAGWSNQLKMNSTKYQHVMPEAKPKKLRDIIDSEKRKEERSIKRNS